MDLTQYDIVISRHAFIRAMERGVTPDMVEAVLKGGKIQRFGDDHMRFAKAYKAFEVVCVGQIISTTIKIITIETKR